ncbi:MAG: hypothetical protein OXI48_09910 [bacterium]|nr:hypothetical protein [bacterium]
MTRVPEPPPLQAPGTQTALARSKSPRAVIWLLAVLVVGVVIVAGLLGVQLYQDVQAENAAQEKVRWLAQEHDVSLERWQVAYERADELRQRCVDGDDVGFEWVTELGVALAHADRALESGSAALEEAHETGQSEVADRISEVLSANLEGWATEQTRYELLVSSPLALNCQ